MTKRPAIGSAHEALDRMFDQIGRQHGPNGAPSEGMILAIGFLDIARSTLYRQMDPSAPGGFTFTHACQLAERYGCTEAAAYLAACAGGFFVPAPPEGDAAVQLTAEAMRETSEAAAKIFASAALDSEGGVEITPAEARAALPDVRDALMAMSSLYARLSAKANGGR